MDKAGVFSEATISPNEIVAADSAEFIIKLTIGSGYTAEPSRIIFDFPGLVGTSRPTRQHQEEHGYVQAYVMNPDVGYDLRIWDLEGQTIVGKKGGAWRGQATRFAVLDLDAGLKEGDVVELHWGDTGRGYGPGTRISHVVPRLDYRPLIHVRYFDSQEKGLPDFGRRNIKGIERPVPDCEIPLSILVKPREADHVHLFRKATGAILAPHDVYSNVAEVDTASAVAEIDGEGEQNEFGAFDFADKDVTVSPKGLQLLQSADMADVFEGLNLYWGDIHTHSEFSVDCIEREKMDMDPDALMRFARRRAALDYYAVTDHQQPWDIERHKIGKEYWARTIDAARQNSKPGEFLAFAGIEYRCPRGDTAVVFNWLPDYEEIDQADHSDIRKLWEGLKGKDYLAIPHFHNAGRLEDGEWWKCPDENVEPVLEIFSCHGSYEREDALEHQIPLMKARRPDRYAAYMLKQGLRYGLVCNSDSHKGHVGSNGVTAAFAASLDADAIFGAYRKRHVYGTTNARIRLVFTGNGALMGSVVKNEPDKHLMIDVVGDNELKKIEVFRNADFHERLIPDGRSFKTELTVREDEPSNWYVRVTQKDNQIAWSSPIWFE